MMTGVCRRSHWSGLPPIRAETCKVPLGYTQPQKQEAEEKGERKSEWVRSGGLREGGVERHCVFYREQPKPTLCSALQCSAVQCAEDLLLLELHMKRRCLLETSEISLLAAVERKISDL